MSGWIKTGRSNLKAKCLCGLLLASYSLLNYAESDEAKKKPQQQEAVPSLAFLEFLADFSTSEGEVVDPNTFEVIKSKKKSCDKTKQANCTTVKTAQPATKSAAKPGQLSTQEGKTAHAQ